MMTNLPYGLTLWILNVSCCSCYRNFYILIQNANNSSLFVRYTFSCYLHRLLTYLEMIHMEKRFSYATLLKFSFIVYLDPSKHGCIYKYSEYIFLQRKKNNRVIFYDVTSWSTYYCISYIINSLGVEVARRKCFIKRYMKMSK